VSANSPLDRWASTASELEQRLDAERRGVAFLVYRDNAHRQVIVELTGDPLTIGRRDDNDVTLAWDKEVSRLHAQIERIKGEWCLVDEGLSRNGSFVNGERMTGRRRLRDGDRLCFGSTIAAFRAPPASEVESTVGPVAEIDPVSLSEIQRKILVALSRPLGDSASATPATNREIADEVFLSVDAVKAHLRVLFDRFGVSELPQNRKRATLAAGALLNGIVKPRDL
jgi:pSer/pThr/pTyr-binding forkhead associated (FHA) protein